ncbi:hypothetical protein EV702DRAFT_1045350 [Suillus placidus]|uniref:Uncharacterized protein n=1 Tax=Suillus placidus TaxID=48579 RepID=A0A9P6ZWA8_9AGAM|nr:hypothetical protein EV702DRAFT_1045350 [Suillus placidus]
MWGATDPDMSHKFKSPVSSLSTALQYANEEKGTHRDTSRIRNGFGGVALTQSGSQVARVVGERKPYTAELNYKIDSEAWKDVDKAAMKNLKKEHSPSISHATETVIVKPVKQKESKRTASEAESGQKGEVIGIGTITWTHTVMARQSYKRKIDDVQVNDNHDTAKNLENHDCICREKTGTDWQTVLNINKYGEEREKLAGERMTEES